MGVVQGRVVADVDAYDRLAFADGRCPLTWRQGVKHDAASVIELTQDGDGRLVNKRGEVVSIEPNYLYPLLKGSDLQWHPCMPHRTIIVPQRRLGEETAALLQTAPNLWRYLTDRADVFDRRKSAIYRAQPRFAFFGLGDYSFAPYKVAVCGFHKAPLFRAIGPVDGRPVLFDDTCYFVACSSAQQAAFLSGLLNDPLSAKVIGALMFVDAKRPITKKLLQRIDLLAVLGRVEAASLQARATAELLRLDPACEEQDIRWPESLETFLRGETSLANQPGRPTQLTLLDSVT